MAKDVFYRSKPHVNVGIAVGLRELGFSELGAQQIASGQIMTNPDDRFLLAEVIEASALPTGKRQHKPYSVTANRANSAGQ